MNEWVMNIRKVAVDQLCVKPTELIPGSCLAWGRVVCVGSICTYVHIHVEARDQPRMLFFRREKENLRQCLSLAGA